MTTTPSPGLGEREAVARAKPMLIRQQDAYGCSVACMAMVLCRTYEAVRADVGPPGRGFAYHTWQEYIGRHGFAYQLFFRHDCLARKDRDPWPLESWADVHLCSVDAGHGDGSHLVVMLADGTILDPMSDVPKRLSDYPSVLYMAAVFQVEPLRTENETLRARAEEAERKLAERPLTAAALADALDCFSNAAIGAMHSGPATECAIAQGIQAVAWRLEEISKETKT